MMKETEPAENHGEKGAPFGVVVRLEVQGVRNQGRDGDAVDGVGEGNTRCCGRDRPGGAVCWSRIDAEGHRRRGLEKRPEQMPHQRRPATRPSRQWKQWTSW
jgi:hypothetical protein